LRLAQFHTLFDNKNRLASAMSHMHMNRKILVAVEEELKPILFKKSSASVNAKMFLQALPVKGLG
jgi:hypothetical protein